MIPPDEIKIQLRLRDIPTQYIPSEEPGQVLPDLVAREAGLAHVEDGVEVLESAALGLFHEEEDEDQGYEVQASEEAEGPAVAESCVDAVVFKER